jgi:hypothetical protein
LIGTVTTDSTPPTNLKKGLKMDKKHREITKSDLAILDILKFLFAAWLVFHAFVFLVAIA